MLGRKPEVLQSQEAETTEAATSAPDLGVFSHGYILLVKSPSLSLNRLMCQPGCPFLPRLSVGQACKTLRGSGTGMGWKGLDCHCPTITSLSLPRGFLCGSTVPGRRGEPLLGAWDPMWPCFLPLLGGARWQHRGVD